MTAPRIDERDARGRERRRYPRHRILENSDLVVVEIGTGTGLLLDLSAAGLAVQGDNSLGPGQRITLKLELPGTDGVFHPLCEVAWADKQGRSGLKFLHLSHEDQRQLEKWLETHPDEASAGPPAEDAELVALQRRCAGVELDAALLSITQAARERTGADGAALALADPEEVVCRASSGTAPAVGARLNGSSGLSGECLRNGSVISSADARNDSRVDPAIASQLKLGSFLAVPILLQGSVTGLIEVISSRPAAFSNVHREVLQRLAAIVASLVETKSDRQADTAPDTLADEQDFARFLNQIPAVLETSTAAKPAASIQSLPQKHEPVNKGVPARTTPMPVSAAAQVSPPEAARPVPAQVRAPQPPMTQKPVQVRPVSAEKRPVRSTKEVRLPTFAALDRKVGKDRRVLAYCLIAGGIVIAASLWMATSDKWRSYGTESVSAKVAQPGLSPTAPPASNAAISAPAASSEAAPGAASQATAHSSSETTTSTPLTPAKPSGRANQVVEPAPAARPAPAEVKLIALPSASPAAPDIAPPVVALSTAARAKTSLPPPAAQLPVRAVETAKPAPARSSAEPLHVPAEVMRQRMIVHPAPAYPDFAWRAKIQGTVALAVVIAADGTVKNIRILSGDPELAAAAADAVRQWRYEPYLQDGKPVEVSTEINFVFTLP